MSAENAMKSTVRSSVVGSAMVPASGSVPCSTELPAVPQNKTSIGSAWLRFGSCSTARKPIERWQTYPFPQ